MKRSIYILIALTAILLDNSITGDTPPKGKWMKVPLRFQQVDNLVTDGGLIRLRREYRQEKDRPIVFEAEEATLLEFKNSDQKIISDPNASSGHYIEHVKMMEYDFEVVTPGKYQVRLLSYYLIKANYNHREQMDGGKAAMVIDSNSEPPKLWRWTKGKIYDLNKGKHRYIFPSPHAFCGGARLDKVVLIPISNIEVTGLGPASSPFSTANKGTAVTRRIKLKKINRWKLNYEIEKNQGTATVEYTYDKSKGWHPVTSGKVMKVPVPKPTYIYFRFSINAKSENLSPWLQGVKFTIIKESKTGVK